MKVTFIGELNIEQLAKKLIEVADSTALRVEQENEGVKITGYELHDAEVTVKFNVEGMEEPQVLTVEHHKGHPEMLTWIVDMDNEKESSNEDESQFDAYTVAKVKDGKEPEFKEIESIYNIKDLTEIEELTESYGNMSKKVYEHTEGYRVAQIRQNKKLVQEVKLIPKETKEEQTA